MVGFKLGQDADGNFSENRSLSVLQKYASEIGLDKKTGIEITESAPHVSDSYAVPSYIGQGTNAYTTSQLARYATAIATSGNVYDLTLLDRQTDSKGNTLKKYEPDIINTVDVSPWAKTSPKLRTVNCSQIPLTSFISCSIKSIDIWK